MTHEGLLPTDKKSTLVSQTLLYFFMPISTMAAIYLIWSSRNLRPIADDYWVAAMAKDGLLDAIKFWYTTWGGDVFSTLLNTILVGLPLLYFPWSLASSFAFMITFAGILVSTAKSMSLYLNYSFERGVKNSWIAISTIFLSLVSWVAFWWTSPSIVLGDSLAIDPLPMQISISATVWQNVGIAYVFSSCLVLLAVLSLLKSIRKNKGIHSRHLFLASLLGLIVGTSGLVLAVSMLIASFVAIVFLLTTVSKLASRQSQRLTYSFQFGTLLGMLITYFSPGTQNRVLVEASNPSQPEKNLIEIFSWILPKGLWEWLSGLASVGSLVTFGCALLIGIIASTEVNRQSLYQAGWLAFVLFAFSSLVSVVSQLSEAFSYDAYWHQVSPRSLLFISLSLFGFILGLKVGWLGGDFVLISSFAALVAGFIAIGSVLYFTQYAEDRLAVWEVGPAPSFGIPDTEEIWRNACYLEIKDYRGGPDRSGGKAFDPYPCAVV